MKSHKITETKIKIRKEKQKKEVKTNLNKNLTKQKIRQQKYTNMEFFLVLTQYWSMTDIFRDTLYWRKLVFSFPVCINDK